LVVEGGVAEVEAEEEHVPLVVVLDLSQASKIWTYCSPVDLGTTGRAGCGQTGTRSVHLMREADLEMLYVMQYGSGCADAGTKGAASDGCQRVEVAVVEDPKALKLEKSTTLANSIRPSSRNADFSLICWGTYSSIGGC